MYQFLRADFYKMRHDRSLYILLLLFFLIICRTDMPALILHNFTYTGGDPLVEKLVQDSWKNHYDGLRFVEIFRRQVCAFRLSFFGTFYLLIFLRREILWRGYETQCSIRPERTKIVLANIFSNLTVALFFPFVEGVIIVLEQILEKGNISGGDFLELLPFLVTLTLFYLTMLVVLYAVAFLSEQPLVAIVLYISVVIVDVVVFSNILTATFNAVLKYVNFISLIENLQYITDWNSALPYISVFAIIILVLGGLIIGKAETTDVC